MINNILQQNAQRILTNTLQTDVHAYIDHFSAERAERNHQLVMRNHSHLPHEILTNTHAVK